MIFVQKFKTGYDCDVVPWDFATFDFRFHVAIFRENVEQSIVQIKRWSVLKHFKLYPKNYEFEFEKFLFHFSSDADMKFLLNSY